MAIRYSGAVKLRVTLHDDDTFRVVLSVDGRWVETLTEIRLAPAWPHSLDCPHAFDEAARAALSFADSTEVQGHSSWGDRGAIVLRSPFPRTAEDACKLRRRLVRERDRLADDKTIFSRRRDLQVLIDFLNEY